MEPVKHQELNRPSSLEAMLRDDFYNKKHRIKMSEVELKPIPYNRLSMLMRDAKKGFIGGDVSMLKDDFKPY